MYLILYNLYCVVGWSYLWFLQISYYVNKFDSLSIALISRYDNFWELISPPLKFIQTSAVVEVLHALLGIVRSPVLPTTVQSCDLGLG